MSSMDGHPHAPTIKEGIQNSIKIRERKEEVLDDQLKPIAVWPDGSGFVIKVQPGYVEEVIPKSGVDCVVIHPIYYAGSVLTGEEEIAVADGYTVVVSVNQDATGQVETSAGPPTDLRPTLSVVPIHVASTHWYPEDPDEAGSGGTLVIPLYKVDNVSGVAELTEYHWGPIVIRNDLWQGVNVGAGKRLFQRHTETEGAVYKFRTLTEGEGITLTENADDVKIEAEGFTHPWKVTSNDDNTVSVAKGNVGWWEEQNTPELGTPGTGEPFVHTYHKQAATASVTVTGTGFIVFVYDTSMMAGPYYYGTVAGNTHQTYRPGEYLSGGSVKFSADPTVETEDIVLVLAEVSLDASVSQVDEQIITHNPIIHIPYTEASS